MSSIAALNRSSVLAAAKALGQSVVNSGVPTHKYLSFNAQQAHFYVRENDKETEVDVGTELVLNWQEIMHGYICWKDRKPHDQINWNLFEMPILPSTDTLPDHGPYVNDDKQTDGWVEQVTLPMKDPKTGVEYLFKSGPNSAVRALRGFLRDFQTELMLRASSVGEDEDFVLVPKVILGKSFFVPRGRTNRVHVPKITLVDAEWIDQSEVEFTKVPTATGSFMRETIDGPATTESGGKTIDANAIEE